MAEQEWIPDKKGPANPLIGHRQYLVTYSQANLDLFPTRKSFGEAVVSAFNDGWSLTKVQHWACALEPHEEEGYHYHCSLKLTGVKKWPRAVKVLHGKYQINVDISSKGLAYVYAYRYVCKVDEHVYSSQGHPELEEYASPRTKEACKAYRRRAPKRKPEEHAVDFSGDNATTNRQPVKRISLTNLEVSEFIFKNNIKSTTALYAAAEQRKNDGDPYLYGYLCNRRLAQSDELIQKTWKFKNAASELSRAKRLRLDVMKDFLEAEHSNPDCEWFRRALEVLEFNKITPEAFGGYLKDLLENGRAKFRNMLIIGRSNCAKSFLFQPLKTIFKGRVFDNPSNDKYAWVGADKADVILLQDFRYSHELIPWKDLLLLLEGETVRLPAPKNHFASDVVIDTDIPIFATSIGRIKYKGPYNTTDEIENDMMNSRWKVLEFHHVFPEEKQIKMKPCARCFARLVMFG